MSSKKKEDEEPSEDENETDDIIKTTWSSIVDASFLTLSKKTINNESIRTPGTTISNANSSQEYFADLESMFIFRRETTMETSECPIQLQQIRLSDHCHPTVKNKDLHLKGVDEETSTEDSLVVQSKSDETLPSSDEFFAPKGVGLKAKPTADYLFNFRKTNKSFNDSDSDENTNTCKGNPPKRDEGTSKRTHTLNVVQVFDNDLYGPNRTIQPETGGSEDIPLSLGKNTIEDELIHKTLFKTITDINFNVLKSISVSIDYPRGSNSLLLVKNNMPKILRTIRSLENLNTSQILIVRSDTSVLMKTAIHSTKIASSTDMSKPQTQSEVIQSTNIAPQENAKVARIENQVYEHINDKAAAVRFLLDIKGNQSKLHAENVLSEDQDQSYNKKTSDCKDKKFENSNNQSVTINNAEIANITFTAESSPVTLVKDQTSINICNSNDLKETIFVPHNQEVLLTMPTVQLDDTAATKKKEEEWNMLSISEEEIGTTKFSNDILDIKTHTLSTKIDWLLHETENNETITIEEEICSNSSKTKFKNNNQMISNCISIIITPNLSENAVKEDNNIPKTFVETKSNNKFEDLNKLKSNRNVVTTESYTTLKETEKKSSGSTSAKASPMKSFNNSIYRIPTFIVLHDKTENTSDAKNITLKSDDVVKTKLHLLPKETSKPANVVQESVNTNKQTRKSVDELNSIKEENKRTFTFPDSSLATLASTSKNVLKKASKAGEKNSLTVPDENDILERKLAKRSDNKLSTSDDKVELHSKIRLTDVPISRKLLLKTESDENEIFPTKVILSPVSSITSIQTNYTDVSEETLRTNILPGITNSVETNSITASTDSKSTTEKTKHYPQSTRKTDDRYIGSSSDSIGFDNDLVNIRTKVSPKPVYSNILPRIIESSEMNPFKYKKEQNIVLLGQNLLPRIAKPGETKPFTVSTDTINNSFISSVTVIPPLVSPPASVISGVLSNTSNITKTKKTVNTSQIDINRIDYNIKEVNLSIVEGEVPVRSDNSETDESNISFIHEFEITTARYYASIINNSNLLTDISITPSNTITTINVNSNFTEIPRNILSEPISFNTPSLGPLVQVSDRGEIENATPLNIAVANTNIRSGTNEGIIVDGSNLEGIAPEFIMPHNEDGTIPLHAPTISLNNRPMQRGELNAMSHIYEYEITTAIYSSPNFRSTEDPDLNLGQPTDTFRPFHSMDAISKNNPRSFRR